VTTPISGSTPTVTPPNSSSTSATGFDKDTFMKLLVAQLKYQNPDQPTDSGAYMQQMAMFAQVEKMGQMLDAQNAAAAVQTRISAEGVVGMQVTGSDADAALHTGVVTGVVFGSGDPSLTLADGTTLALSSLTKVEQPGTTSTTP
jgi:flagellar basal-body rod modification protein FlgD